MRYSIEPRGRSNVKGYGFVSFAKNIGKNLSNKYCQKLLDDANKNCFKNSNSKNSRGNW